MVNNFLTIQSTYGPFIVNRHCDQQIESLAKTGKPHIQEELNYILKVVDTLPENSIIIDAGANIGLVTIPIAHAVKHKNSKVYAYEVQRMLYYALCGAVALNDLENVFPRLSGLGNKNETLFVPHPEYGTPQDYGMVKLTDREIPGHEEIFVTTIDHEDFPRLDFLKIDVEGMDVAVLQGAHETIHKHMPWCWVEYWQVGIEEIKKQFEGLDYRFYKMDALNLLCAPLEKQKASGLYLNQLEV